MLGLEAYPHLTRSSWHVMSSMHRFSWLPNSESSIALQCYGHFVTIDFVRPNVALVSTEDHTCLYEAIYGVPQVEHFTSFEEAGCKADVAFLHFELDGFSANHFLPAQRREVLESSGALRRLPYISMHHCGNHAGNLNDNCTLTVCDETMFNWLSAGCCFFRMGGGISFG